MTIDMSFRTRSMWENQDCYRLKWWHINNPSLLTLYITIIHLNLAYGWNRPTHRREFFLICFKPCSRMYSTKTNSELIMNESDNMISVWYTTIWFNYMVGNSASLKGVNYSLGRGGIAFTKAPYFLSSLCVPTQMNKNSKTKPNRNILNPANE